MFTVNLSFRLITFVHRHFRVVSGGEAISIFFKMKTKNIIYSNKNCYLRITLRVSFSCKLHMRTVSSVFFWRLLYVRKRPSNGFNVKFLFFLGNVVVIYLSIGNDLNAHRNVHIIISCILQLPVRPAYIGKWSFWPLHKEEVTLPKSLFSLQLLPEWMNSSLCGTKIYYMTWWWNVLCEYVRSRVMTTIRAQEYAESPPQPSLLLSERLPSIW